MPRRKHRIHQANPPTSVTLSCTHLFPASVPSKQLAAKFPTVDTLWTQLCRKQSATQLSDHVFRLTRVTRLKLKMFAASRVELGFSIVFWNRKAHEHKKCLESVVPERPYPCSEARAVFLWLGTDRLLSTFSPNSNKQNTQAKATVTLYSAG